MITRQDRAASTEEGSSFDDASSASSARSTDARAPMAKLDLNEKVSHMHRKSHRASRKNLLAMAHSDKEEGLSSLKKEGSLSSPGTLKKTSLVDFRVAFQNALHVNDDLTLCVLVATYHSFLKGREFLALIRSTYATSASNFTIQTILLRVVGEWVEMRMSKDMINPKTGKPRRVLRDLVTWLESIQPRPGSAPIYHHQTDVLWECSHVTRTKLAIYRNSQDARFPKRARLGSSADLGASSASHAVFLHSSAPPQPTPEQLAMQADRETRNEHNAFARFFVLMAPYDIAQALVHIEHAMFKKIRPRELLQQAWKRVRPDPPRETAVSRFISRSTELSFWVATKIVKTQDLDARVSLVERFIEVAEACVETRNYNSCMGVFGGLNLHPVSRLKKTWAKVPKDLMKKMASLESLLETKGNYRNYRAAIRTHRTNHPEKLVLPYLGVYLRDLVFCDEGMDSKVEGMLNMEKLQVALQVLSEVRQFQQATHTRGFMEDPDLISYYSNLRGSPDVALEKMSRLIEPPQNAASNFNTATSPPPVVVTVSDSQLDNVSTNSDSLSQTSSNNNASSQQTAPSTSTSHNNLKALYQNSGNQNLSSSSIKANPN